MNDNDYTPQNKIPEEEDSFGISSSIEYKGKNYSWEQFRNTSIESVEDTEADGFEIINEAESSGKPLKESTLKSSDSSASTSEDKMCRICFAGTEEESNLGHLISPCQCKGTMRYVHVECLNQWRLKSQKKSSFFQCDECKYKYAFRRTTIAKFATNEFILTLVTLSFFVICVLMGGFFVKFILYLRPFSDDSVENDDDEDDREPLFKEPITLATIFTIDFNHFTLGFMLVGLVGFIQLLFSIMWFGPIPSWNFRLGSTGSSGRGQTDGVTAFVFAIIVIIGVLKATWGMYKLVRGASRKLLERIELTILEVNEA